MTLIDERAGGADSAGAAPKGPKPVFEGTKKPGEQTMLYTFVIVPFLAFLAAIPVAWGWGLGWTDVVLFLSFYIVSGLGITVGYHRLFTHSSFKANRPLRIALAIAGSMAIEGPVIRWVADHRRHHAFSDKEGDPHSPWRFGDTKRGLAKGFWFAHIGWLFDLEHTNREKYTPDLLRDKDIRVVDKLFPVWVLVSVFGPATIGGLVSMSWAGALSAFFWASLVRIFVLHHVTWSINSVCHMIGQRPFSARDKSANFWPLAIVSFGESWHNMHHADPTAARHGVLKGQLDSSARMIWLFEKFGWATDVRWPKPERLEKLRVG
ncbi:stearoyl-CoA desaturase (delta-9 desaturase) [Jatrophihabitans endophyticus]|uniref:Stearoyl-CoA desaturase (Delta-9 desaturase) n=1 Tax=Jatrophihabitans endophyticus TaxID=1206085 RepID=A0A1M5U538_9ACTN|nr:acyl-CoA desaturase [Jatrophihabitans endophyticus]SHH57803.1 stearoyl-CoA desaturase (delta-9 desaturase) [Jatrophihabitans endophyticus]